NVAAQGFPAIDYLLYSDANVLAKFTTDANAANRKKYLKDITTLAKQRIEATHNTWITNYKTTFIQAQGTAVGSAVGYLVISLNEEIDLTKGARVGIPVGKYTAGDPFPAKVEAYYSQKSLTLLVRNLQAMKAMFM